MKKLIYLFTLLFLFSGVPEAVAWMSPVIAGGGVPLAGECANTITEDPCDSSDGGYDMWKASNIDWSAQKFQASESYTLCKTDVVLRKVGTPNFNFYIQIFSNSCSTCDRSDDTPGSIIGGTESDAISSSTFTESFATYLFINSSFALTSGDWYWVVVMSKDSYGDNDNYVVWAYDIDVVGENEYSGDGSSWTSYAADRTLRFINYK